MDSLRSILEKVKTQSVREQIKEMIQLFKGEKPTFDKEDLALYQGIVNDIIKDQTISSKEKSEFGECINKWGDPRLVSPDELEYWVELEINQHSLKVGRYLVTIKEWVQFLENGYDNEENWSQQGLEWRAKGRSSWQALASAEGSQKYIFDNQPVVGICWFEAEAYAKANKARMMSFYERELIVRGQEKRPYPWGAPFGHGNANTQEEGLEKPCAVGLYNCDSTPDGIFDLAGNVAEWTEDEIETKRVIHPGSWKIDSMGAWVKASSHYSAAARTAYLGFRLVQDN